MIEIIFGVMVGSCIGLCIGFLVAELVATIEVLIENNPVLEDVLDCIIIAAPLILFGIFLL